MTETDIESKTEAGSSASFVDWEFAKATGRRLVSAGPQVSITEAADIVGKEAITNY